MQYSTSTTPTDSPTRLHYHKSSSIPSSPLNPRVETTDPFSEVSPPPRHSTPHRSVRHIDTDIKELMKLESELKCSVCKNFYDLPMSSKCQHTFCAGCAKFDSDNHLTGLCCPICEYSFTSFTQFYKNIMIEDLIKEYKNNSELIARLYTLGKQVEERERREEERKSRLIENKVAKYMKEKPFKSISNFNSDLINDSSLIEEKLKSKFASEKSIKIHDIYDSDSNDSNKQSTKKRRIFDDIESFSPNKKVHSPNKLHGKKPKVVYSLMNDRKLKNLLKEEGLVADGTKCEMIARHSYYTNLYNSNIDATNPKSKGELLRDMKKWERAQHSNEAKDAYMLKKSLTNQEGIDSYADKYRDEFANLIQQAKINKKRKEIS